MLAGIEDLAALFALEAPGMPVESKALATLSYGSAWANLYSQML